MKAQDRKSSNQRPRDNKRRGTKKDEGASNVPKVAAAVIWEPKTELGKRVKEGKITELGEILTDGKTYLESEIVDHLVPNMKSDLLLVGQAKGKFGGGQRRVFRQTQKKSRDGNRPSFLTMAVIGNENGYVGIGTGKGRETVPAREKALRQAKLNVIQVKRGCGSWVCGCKTPHSVPFKVTGKCGSVEITLMPAPRGTGLCVEKECAKVLKMAGYTDVWAKTKGMTVSKVNLLSACFDALKKISTTRVMEKNNTDLGIHDGPIEVVKNEN